MTRTELFTQSSPWYLFICLLLGGLYAFLLYQKKPIWSKSLNYALAGIRFFIVSFICFLLLSPVIKQIKNYIEKPIVLIAVDNSESINEVHNRGFLGNVLKNLQALGDKLGEDFQVDYQTFSSSELNKLDSVKFNYPTTNLSAFLSSIQSKYENMNLTSVVFLSDGIYNQGISPNYLPYNFTVYPIALGDTVSKKDLNLKNIIYNKVAYRSNKFPIVVEFTGEGFGNENAVISLKQNNKILESQTVKISSGNLTQVTFYASSDQPGLQHYVISITPITGEFTTKNNFGHAYIDVIDNKEKILLVALAPHPDVKAIKTSLETKENYEFFMFIPGISEPPKDTKFDLVIFHQIPDVSNINLPVFTEYYAKAKNHLFIISTQSNITQFNNLTQSIDIFPRGTQKDEVTPAYNSTFERFTLSPEFQNSILKYPPIIVPFAEFQVPPNYDVILSQKVGAVQTNKPIIAVGSENDKKTGVILGNGIWEWRLEEYAQNNNTQSFDELITKIVQYLSSKEDKRKFRVYPISNEIYENEPVILETEVYNNIYEKIYGQKIELEIVDENSKKQKFTYTNSENNSRYEIGGLKSGIYRYRASTIVDKKTEISSGEFIVKELQLEALNITANHGVLRELARNSGGQLYYPDQIASLDEFLIKNKAQGRVHGSEENIELIHLKWLFFLILLLITAEWVLRKYFGAY